MMAPHSLPWRPASDAVGLAGGGVVLGRSRSGALVRAFPSPPQRQHDVEARWTAPCQNTHSDCRAPRRQKRAHGLKSKPDARMIMKHTAPPPPPRVMGHAGSASACCRSDCTSVARTLTNRWTKETIFTQGSC